MNYKFLKYLFAFGFLFALIPKVVLAHGEGDGHGHPNHADRHSHSNIPEVVVDQVPVININIFRLEKVKPVLQEVFATPCHPGISANVVSQLSKIADGLENGESKNYTVSLETTIIVNEKPELKTTSYTITISKNYDGDCCYSVI